MTTPLPPHDDDDLPGEAELKALYDRLPSHEPGPALDAAVLRAAAAAVASDAPQRHTRRRWPVALGTAATLVLAAGLAWHMRKLPADLPTASPASAPAAAAPAEVDAARTSQAAGKLADAAAKRAEPAAMQARRRESAPQPAAIASQATVAEDRRAYARPALKAQSRVASSSAPSANGIATPKPATPVTPAPAPASAERTDRAAPLREVASAAPAPLPPPAPPAPPAEVMQAAPAPQAESAPTAPSADAPSMMMKLRAASPEETMTPAMAAELQAIRLLYAHGDTTAARARLDAFHREHPHAVLPPDLQRHLDTTP
jgi:Meckel syndrome type 1 protein